MAGFAWEFFPIKPDFVQIRLTQLGFCFDIFGMSKHIPCDFLIARSFEKTFAHCTYSSLFLVFGSSVSRCCSKGNFCTPCSKSLDTYNKLLRRCNSAICGLWLLLLFSSSKSNDVWPAPKLQTIQLQILYKLYSKQILSFGFLLAGIGACLFFIVCCISGDFVAEDSVDWQANIQAIQNLMGFWYVLCFYILFVFI
jgi:hypothetical protein